MWSAAFEITATRLSAPTKACNLAGSLPIDVAGAARALGARGTRVEDDAAFEPALRQALVSDRPTLLHLVLDRRWEGPDSRP